MQSRGESKAEKNTMSVRGRGGAKGPILKLAVWIALKPRKGAPDWGIEEDQKFQSERTETRGTSEGVVFGNEHLCSPGA